jgi:F-type H+-transporting ATPase subunit b
MSSNASKSSLPYPVMAVIGAVLMVGGTYVSLKKLVPLESLEKMGIPIDLGSTIATVGVLLIVFPLIKMFFTDPLSQAIGERNENLEHTFAEAESLRAEMTKTRTEYEARLVAAEASAREHIEAQIKEAQKLRQTLMNEAATRADAMIDKAQQEIAAEREKILTGLRNQVVELSLVAAERIIGENMDNDRNRKLVDEFVSGLEVTR